MSQTPLDLSPPPVEHPRSGKRMVLAFIFLLVLLAPAPWLLRRGASRLAFFHVRKIEVEGTRYLAPDTVVSRLALDTLRSVWDDTRQLESRVLQLPQVADVSISRRLPSTLVVRIQENLPVALAPGPQGLGPVDSSGHMLPIDPSRQPLDLPIATQNDVVLTRMLGQVRVRNGALFRRISEVMRDGADDIVLLLSSNAATSTTIPRDSLATGIDSLALPAATGPRLLRVRAHVGVSAARLTDIFPVEFDLRRRGARVAELDLRYRDQVIARLQ